MKYIELSEKEKKVILFIYRFFNSRDPYKYWLYPMNEALHIVDETFSVQTEKLKNPVLTSYLNEYKEMVQTQINNMREFELDTTSQEDLLDSINIVIRKLEDVDGGRAWDEVEESTVDEVIVEENNEESPEVEENNEGSEE